MWNVTEIYDDGKIISRVKIGSKISRITSGKFI